MNETIDNLGKSDVLLCPQRTNWDKCIDGHFRFWVHGILLCVIAIPGFLMNLAAIFVLSIRKEMKNTFNYLLISLFVFDNMCLLFYLVDSFTYGLGFHTKIFEVLYPHFILPFRNISLAASIFMTVGITYERYLAIKRPIFQRQSMRSARFRRSKITKYIMFVLFSAIILNIPKWFEYDINWYWNTSEELEAFDFCHNRTIIIR